MSADENRDLPPEEVTQTPETVRADEAAPSGEEDVMSYPALPEEAAAAAAPQPAELAQPVPEPIVPADPTATFLAETEGHPPRVRAGEALRARRIEMKLSLEDVSRATLIPLQYLTNIEAMMVKNVPRQYFMLQVAAYSKYLGLKGDKVLPRYTEHCGALSEAPEKMIDTTPKSRLIAQVQWASVIAGGFVAVVALTMLFTQLFATPKDELEMADAQARSGLPVLDISGEGGRDILRDRAALDRIDAQADLPFEIEVVERTWVEVRGADGTVFRDRVMGKGERILLRVDAGWTVSARDGGALVWRYGDTVAGALGEPGQPVFAVSVDEAAARAADVVAPVTAQAGDTPPRR